MWNLTLCSLGLANLAFGNLVPGLIYCLAGVALVVADAWLDRANEADDDLA